MSEPESSAPAAHRDALRLALTALEASIDNFPANVRHRRAIEAVRTALFSSVPGVAMFIVTAPLDANLTADSVSEALNFGFGYWDEMSEENRSQVRVAAIPNAPSPPRLAAQAGREGQATT